MIGAQNGALIQASKSKQSVKMKKNTVTTCKAKGKNRMRRHIRIRNDEVSKPPEQAPSSNKKMHHISEMATIGLKYPMTLQLTRAMNQQANVVAVMKTLGHLLVADWIL